MEPDGGKMNVLDGYSPAKIFEARLMEVKQHAKQTMTADRAQVLFEVFDEVLPQLGIFKNVLTMARNEIFEAVYSDQYTSSKETHTPYSNATNVVTDRKEEQHTFIQRIPYFTLVQRVYAERHEEAANLREEIEDLRKLLADKTAQQEETAAIVASQTSKIADLKDEIMEALQTIEDKDMEIVKLNQDLEELTQDTDKERRNLEFQKRKLQERVSVLEKEIGFLSQYKNGYDTLQDAFNAKIEEDKYTSRKSRRSVFANKKNHLMTNLDSAKKLERQLLEVQNQTIEEFESFLEAHKSELQHKVLRDTSDVILEREYDEEEMELERLDTELGTAQDLFQQTITALNTELDMIRQHKDAIQQQMQQQVEKPRPDAKTPSRSRSVTFKEPSIAGGSSLELGYQYGEEKSVNGKDSSLSVADNFENVDLLSSEMDPFVPQESILSKYSVMIYTSTNNKRTWHELKDGKFCTSCGEKTVLCPHKVNSEKVIMLPHNCSHIKLSRPGVRITMEKPNKTTLKPHPPPTLKLSSTMSESGHPPATDATGNRIRSRYSVLEKDSEQYIFHGDSVTPGIPDSAPASASRVDIKVQQSQDQEESSFMLLWNDYKERTSLTRSIPKTLDMKRTLSIIAQFYAHMLWQDEHALEDEPIGGILSGFYDFMAERYILKDVMYLCVHDFITSLVENSVLNKAIQIFAQILMGNLDAAVFRYLLVISDLIDRVDWQYVEDFKAFATAIYPFLNEDDIDQLHLGYTSFSENKVSKALVCEYLMYIILKYREPRFQDIESKLLQRPGKELGLMNQKEFTEAVDAISPLANEKLRHRMFAESLAHCSEGSKVAIMRLSHVASYLLIQQVAPLLRQKIAEKVEDSRILNNSTQAQNTTTTSEGPTSQKSDESDDIMTAAKLRNLAKNFDRRAQNRSMRRIEGNLRFDMTGMSDETEAGRSSFQRLTSAGDLDGDRMIEGEILEE